MEIGRILSSWAIGSIHQDEIIIECSNVPSPRKALEVAWGRLADKGFGRIADRQRQPMMLTHAAASIRRRALVDMLEDASGRGVRRRVKQAIAEIDEWSGSAEVQLA